MWAKPWKKADILGFSGRLGHDLAQNPAFFLKMTELVLNFLSYKFIVSHVYVLFYFTPI